MSNFVVIPTYNEADNLSELVAGVLSMPVEMNVIVVDDASSDGTGALADVLAAAHPDLVSVIHRAAKLGLGTAYIAGFRRACERDAQRVMTMDADFSHHPRYIPAMIAMSHSFPVVIGSRYVKGGGTSHFPLARQLLSRGANAFARAMLGLRAHDTTAGFRLYRREVLESIPLDKIRSSGYSFLVEMLFAVQRRGWPIGELPIIFEDRRAGRTKISQAEILLAVYTVLRLACSRISPRVRPARPPAGRGRR